MIQTPYLLFLGAAPSEAHTKTATGIAYWRRELCTGVWHTEPIADDLGLPVLTPEDAVAAGAKTLVIGIANAGGVLPPQWIAGLGRALQAGLDVANGLHTRVALIPELATLAREYGRTIHDVRYPDDQTFDVGSGAPRSGKRLLTVGTDCAVGKMFTALAIERELHQRGIAATFRATGQTGILIAGDGIAVDAVISDFLSGAVEALTPANDPDHWDVIEGQGSLFNPAYAGVSLGLLHGAQPDAMVLCHDVSLTHVIGLAPQPLPTIAECTAANEQAARLTNPRARVVGLSLNTSSLSAVAAEECLARYRRENHLPVVDPVRTGVVEVVDAVVHTMLDP